MISFIQYGGILDVCAVAIQADVEKIKFRKPHQKLVHWLTKEELAAFVKKYGTYARQICPVCAVEKFHNLSPQIQFPLNLGILYGTFLNDGGCNGLTPQQILRI
ncbi:MAG: hypothetical protein HFF46_08540 [Lawsonibacter sp.]|nr:hypothetical protein [Lawsonibacter sp.]